ncbi:MAG: hypothetical protein QF483_09945 [Gammaproteobacteria bacterium]|jgi:hypothetical protein|nr:hypothetical protein [Gammaproteobacteria bacterium]MDP7297568.1 hypothetical protein [Gammaproteobacteria bacterium]MDP7420195.1 hypothetical protein [Gammaproteobacteria bacterium]HJP40070.1 hypothetical protein [Gammaproteobacteria bacterium]
MNINSHNVLVFFHLVLFVYAIGGDIAVYLIGKYVVRDELNLDERLRVRDIRSLVDMSARTSLVLLLPLGFTLAIPFGSPLRDDWLLHLWIFDLGWLWLVWAVFFTQDAKLRNVDLAIRYALAAAMVGFGVYCLVNQAPIASGWLATKILLFGAIILNGIWIRSIITRWPAAIEMARSGGDSGAEGERTMQANQTSTNKAALLIWILVIVMAFLGKVKPF